MPTYDYLCEHCNYQFEHFQSMSEEPLKKCPECGKSVRRLIGGGLGVIFKGNGFYVNDSKGKKSSAIDSSTASSSDSSAPVKKDSPAPEGKSKPEKKVTAGS